MAICPHCNTREIQLHENGVSTCLECSEARSIRLKAAAEHEIRVTLVQRMLSAVSANDEAAKEFGDAISQARTGAHNPNGAQRIKDAARRLSVARRDMMTAHRRFSEFMDRGVVPEDLKGSG